MKRCAAGDTVPSLYTLSRKTCPCLDCKTVRSSGKLGSLRREHGYCTTLQLISALTRDSYSVCMSDSRGSAIISLTCVQSCAISPTSTPPSFSRPPYGCAVSLHKEFQCILNLFVPEIPVVNSRFFNIFVSVADCIQMVTETDIAFIKEVFSSAGEKKFRAKR